jgi:hypothetical protein
MLRIDYLCNLMKIKIAVSTLFLFLFAIAAPLRAQYSSSWWGIRAGVNLANEAITTPENATVGIKPGILGGLTFEHWFDETWGINASLLYNQKGTSEVYATSAANREIDTTGKENFKLYSGNDDYTLSYLEIPVLLKFSFGEGDIRPYISAGPSFGVLLGASETATGDLMPVTDLKSFLQSVDVSIYGGLGLVDEIYQGPMITFDAGYAAGLTKIYKSSPSRVATDGRPFPDPIDPATAKSGDIRITIGAMWKL